jgi:5-(carboxyamino)imidazole ribonucleotide synthase
MKIGILGGGQLGRMFIQNALNYDDEFCVLDPQKDCSCAHISHFTLGSFNNYDDVLAFGQDKDVISIEIEHVNVDALFELEKQGKSNSKCRNHQNDSTKNSSKRIL